MFHRIFKNFNERSLAGFTLLEVLVSIGLLSIIMSIVWSTTSLTNKSKKRVEDRYQAYHEGAVVLRKISEDLSMAFLAKKVAPQTSPAASAQTLPQPATPDSQASLPERMKSFFIGEDRGERDSLRFTSFSHLRLYKDAKESDQCKLYYEVSPMPGDSSRYNLVRHEEAWLDDTTEVKSPGLVLAEDIKEFNLEYYDQKKDEMVKGWDTEKQDWMGRLPAAVKVSIVLTDPIDPTKTIPMSTSVLLPLSKGPIEY